MGGENVRRVWDTPLLPIVSSEGPKKNRSSSPEARRRGCGPVLDLALGGDVQPVQVVHGLGVLEDLGDLDSRRDELEDVAVVLEGAGLVLGGVAHLERVLQDGDELLDLAVVQQAGGDAPLGGQPFE